MVTLESDVAPDGDSWTAADAPIDEPTPVDGGDRFTSPGTVRATLLLVVGVIVATVGVQRSDIAEVDGIGLLSVLSPWYFVGIACLAAGFARAVVRDRWILSWAFLVAIIVFLHGLPGFLEPNPRFPVTWLHIGFVDQIAPAGELLPFVDARFSWPGFFAAGGFLQQLSGTDSLLWVIRFAPIVLNIAAAALVWNLAAALRSTVRQSAFAAAFFVVANWIGQDYFAPQAIGFLMSMAVLTALLRWLGESTPDTGWRRVVLAAPTTQWPAVSGGQARAVYGSVVVILLALVVTHQLTPVFLGITLIGLAIVGRIRPKMLGLITLVAMAAWLSFGAEAYWLGHLDSLVGSAGQPDSVISDNVSRRAAGGSGDRQLVLTARLWFTGLIWGFTAVTMVVRRFRRSLDPAMVALFGAPFVAILAQPYGGELLLRVALFTLPVCAIVAAQVLVPAHRPTQVVPIVALMVGLVPLFMVARFGNESYEMVQDDAVVLTDVLYEIAPDDSVVFVQNRQTLISTDRVGEVRFRSIADRLSPAEAVANLQARSIDRDGGVFVLLTESQQIYGEQVRGLEAGWMVDFAEEMLEDDAVTLERREGDSFLLSIGEG